MGKAQNKEKREQKSFSFLKKNMVSDGDKSNTEVEK